MPSSTKPPDPVPRKPGRPAPRTTKPAGPPPRPTAEAAAANRPAASQASTTEQTALEEEYDDRDSAMRMWMRNLPAWLISALFHMLLILMLALFDTAAVPKDQTKELSLATVEAEVPLEEILETPELEPFDPEEAVDESVDLADPSEIVESLDNLQITTDPLSEPLESSETEQMAKVEVNVSDILNVTGPQADVLSQVGGLSDGKGLAGGGRSGEGRKVAVEKSGGTQSSEAAVEAALAWLAAHQNSNGSWSFDHRHGGACNGQCNEADDKHAQYLDGATGMALLPFFGAGYTHKEGKYQETIGRGLTFLVNHGKPTANGYQMDGGYMYGHGIATIALCEAYGMSGDSTLRDAAQASLNYIVSKQSPTTGGFGYTGPGQDTSVLGWQMMAFKSGGMAGLHVPPSAIAGIHHNLNNVVGLKGRHGISYYGYNKPDKRLSTTAIGALSRMYMGWPRNPALDETVSYISQSGPQPKNMYYNYYGTQVIFQYTDGDGPAWDKWNLKMRDFLIATQEKEGHETGSWDKSKIATHGGRLYATCMATMVLEIYYRYMPVYKKGNLGGGKEDKNKKAEEEEFKID